jgi:hypothetical protein
VSFAEVVAAAARLPAPFDRDPFIPKNLGNLKTDMAM